MSTANNIVQNLNNCKKIDINVEKNKNFIIL